MFEGFRDCQVEGDGASIFCRIAGSGPPLLLLHGYPQTGAMWAGIAPKLAQRFTVVVPDLRGYGRSEAPDSARGQAYSKRRMAADMVAAMERLGHGRFALAGHDRGARVAYRLALDHPDRVERLAVLDIAPTVEVWEAMGAEAAISTYHWPFLAQPEPLPETLIAADPVYYLDHTLASWTADRSLRAFPPEALAEYRAAFARPGGVHAACEDYRAGATIDVEDDRADRARGAVIEAPLLVLWGAAYDASKGGDMKAIWRRWAAHVEGQGIDCGHFLVEEAPDAVLEALSRFLAA
ncbi:alpha/beta hydrolase [Aurantimonas sp. Leaf443]|uniref:alpha/beta fold hydrolase n=1 Tax=Aurantimonas sp. Leaf443 TaxID=1736378 RepID=UPI0006F9AD98|nr:alpha/beta hydrolase [Aurantimonas sp. Leaf443]KQT87453.1 alpha/beta hydrolase [Aurantimonas sp. Leaf443]